VRHVILSKEERTIMPTKVNVVLDDDVKADLDRLVASGMRSRVINAALRREMALMRRRAASARLDEFRRAGRRTSTAELVRTIRRDRGR
jgi:Arc/MetJ-type ribon-helix-helix transcriptional regulator